MKKEYIYIFFATVLYSSMEVSLKGAGGKFNPFALIFLRFTIGALVLLPFAVRALKKRKVTLSPKDYAFFALTGFICVVVSMTFYQMSLLYVQASVVAILFSCNTVFVVPLAYFFLKEKVYPYLILSVLVSLAGILVVIYPALTEGSGPGIALALAAVLTFALYNVVGRTRSSGYGGIVQTCMSFFFGSAEMLLLILLSHVPAVSAGLTGAGLGDFASVSIFGGITLRLLPILLYVSVGVAGLGYTFYFLAMEETSAAFASIVFLIKPALASLFAFVILGEGVSLQKAAGMGIILCGSLISLIGGWHREKRERLLTAEKTKEAIQ